MIFRNSNAPQKQHMGFPEVLSTSPDGLERTFKVLGEFRLSTAMLPYSMNVALSDWDKDQLMYVLFGSILATNDGFTYVLPASPCQQSANQVEPQMHQV